jgi:hypothetical protein
MRYSYYDLGHQARGSKVVVQLSGSAANVLLLDPTNFARYRAADAFSYRGGLFRRSPAEIEIPRDGYWYVVVDLGGYKGRVRGSIEVRTPDGARSGHSPAARTLVEV